MAEIMHEIMYHSNSCSLPTCPLYALYVLFLSSPNANVGLYST